MNFSKHATSCDRDLRWEATKQNRKKSGSAFPRHVHHTRAELLPLGRCVGSGWCWWIGRTACRTPHNASRYHRMSQFILRAVPCFFFVMDYMARAVQAKHKMASFNHLQFNLEVVFFPDIRSYDIIRFCFCSISCSNHLHIASWCSRHQRSWRLHVPRDLQLGPCSHRVHPVQGPADHGGPQPSSKMETGQNPKLDMYKMDLNGLKWIKMVYSHHVPNSQKFFGTIIWSIPWYTRPHSRTNEDARTDADNFSEITWDNRHISNMALGNPP